MTESLGFGKFKGQPIREVPTGALKHYLAWPALRDESRQVIEAELERRGERQAELPIPPASSPSSTLQVSEAVRRCAFDVIAAGEQTLVTRYPALRETVREAGGLLQQALKTLSPGPSTSPTSTAERSSGDQFAVLEPSRQTSTPDEDLPF